MKTYIQHIEICNFKAFKDFSLDLEGRHLLMYGENGSGKSSLYWALYTFLQSAGKEPKGYIKKYFSSDSINNLLNIHRNSKSKVGKIELILNNASGGKGTHYRISAKHHGTYQKQKILQGDLASDFINYRFFFGFSDFRFSGEFDIWPLFEKEILPFCKSTSNDIPMEIWNSIKDGNPNPSNARGKGGVRAYDRYCKKVEEFSDMLSGIVESINDMAQSFYDDHFSHDDEFKLKLKLELVQIPKASGTSQSDFNFEKPIIRLAIQVGETSISQPQIYLNEAKLTQIALSVRLAASLVNLRESDLKLLVLDDLLVSLDMSNRMKVVEILLSEQFADYQKIILTHDLGFFREFQRIIASDHTDWCFMTLSGNAKDGIIAKNDKMPIEKAEEYLSGHNLEEAAANLRKAAESSVERLNEIMQGKEDLPGKFHTLMDNIRKARNNLQNKIPLSVFERVLKKVPEEHREKIVRLNDDDIEFDKDLDQEIKGILKGQRRKLSNFMSSSGWKYLKTIQVIDQIMDMNNRILNPASHWGEPELYEEEINKAVELIKQLDQHVTLLQKDEQG